MHITYIQPHLPGGIAAYLAILPEQAKPGDYRITFQAQKHLRLRPLGNTFPRLSPPPREGNGLVFSAS